MELVYLWVDNYKNIKEEGFNFSSSWNFEYKNNRLTKTIKTNNLDNFFDENINFTAIVGENGSGKSSLFQIIYFLIYYNKIETEVHNINKKKERPGELIGFKSGRERSSFNRNTAKRIFDELSEEEIGAFLIIYQNEQYYVLKNIDNNIVSVKNLSSTPTEEVSIKSLTENIDTNFIYFNYLGEIFGDSFKSNWYRAFYKDIEFIKNDLPIPLLCEPYITEDHVLDFNFNKKLFSKRYSLILNKIKDNKFINTFFKPNKIKLSINEKYFYDALKILAKNNDRNPFVEVGSSIGYGMSAHNDEYTISDGKYKIIKTYLKNILDKRDLIALTKIGIFFEILLNTKATTNNDISFFRNLFIDESIKKWILEIENLLEADSSIISLVRDKETKISEISGLHNARAFYKYLDDRNGIEVINGVIDHITSIDSFYESLTFLPKWIDVEFYDNEKIFTSLSGGEHSFLKFIVTLLYHIYFDALDKKENIYIFLDEIELGSHPNWQRQLIHKLLLFLKEFDIKTEVILATHSPFILSDIPKENVLFLKDGVESNWLKQEQTFAANIHTLLSDSFFMGNNLMGEFSKSEIKKIIVELNVLYEKSKEEKNKNINLFEMVSEIRRNEMSRIIENIGEPFLKRKLLDMYIKVFEPKKTPLEILEDEKRKLDAKIERLRND